MRPTLGLPVTFLALEVEVVVPGRIVIPVFLAGGRYGVVVVSGQCVLQVVGCLRSPWWTSKGWGLATGCAAMKALPGLNQGRELAEGIVVLDFGKPVAEDVPDAIRSNKDVIAVYLGGDFDSASD